jgi:hypothetical protein
MALIACCCLAAAGPAAAQGTSDAPFETTGGEAPTADSPEQSAAEQTGSDVAADEADLPGTDILSGRTFSILLDSRVVAADGHRSWVDGGLGKTRFDGTSDREFRIRPYPVEAALLWQPRFFGALSGNVSAAWQLDQDKDFDLLEAFLTFLPERRGSVNVSAKAGLYWPEISLEHATGGAWSAVNTISPSAINSWVGEEVKVLGAETTLSVGLGEHELSATAGAFGFNDTSGTLLSFRGWALHDLKAGAFGYFRLPPLNDFIVHLQEDRTRSLLEIDDRVGFYGRAEWRPPWPFVLNAFYYDNRGDPEVFTPAGQWGWRTRFVNLGLSADLGPNTRLLAQGMTGSTIMGFLPKTAQRRWVHTRFRSAYVLVTHQFERFALTARGEFFATRERGSRMSRADESEDGWAATAAARVPINDFVTGFVEALHVRSGRGTRLDLGIPRVEHQNVFQAGLRIRL